MSWRNSKIFRLQNINISTKMLFVNLLVFVFFISNFTFGQTKSDSTQLWSFGFSGSINHSTYRQHSSNPYKTYENVLIISPGGSLIAIRKISKNFTFEFGANYCRLKNHNIYTDSNSKDEAIDEFHLLGFPTLVNWNFGVRKFEFSILAGLEWNFLLQNKRIYNKLINPFIPTPWTKEYQNYNNGQFVFFLNAGLKVNYNLSENISVFIKMEYYRQILPFVYYEKITTGGSLKHERLMHYFKLPIGLIYKI